MKRFLLAGALVLAGAGAFSWSANANPQTCSGTINNVNPAGTVCANGDPATQTGYIYADGNDSNPGAASGYIGVNSDEGVVGCASGDYNNGSDPNNTTPNNVILDPANPPSGPPATGGPCDPSAP